MHSEDELPIDTDSPGPVSDSDGLPSDSSCSANRGRSPARRSAKAPLDAAIEEFVKREEVPEPLPSDGPESYRARIARPCCKAYCTAWIMYEGRACHFLEEWDHQSAHMRKDKDAHDSIIFDTLKNVVTESGKLECKFMDKPLCQKGFCNVLGIGKQRFSKYAEAILHGDAAPPHDSRAMRVREKSEGWHEADAWFQWVWSEIAEFLAENEKVEVVAWEVMDKLKDFNEFDKVPFSGFNEALVGRGALSSSVQSKQEAKYLAANTTLQSLFDLYAAGAGPSEAIASQTTFFRVFQSQWADTLKFRSEKQHTPCNLCTRLKTYRQLAKHPKQKAKVVDALSVHIERVLMDRASFRRSMAAAEHYAKTGTGEQIGFIQVDAMDHAKFAIPRWTAQSKEWESRWRPALQCIGGTVWGVCEYWFLFDCDVRKDANMQCTVFSLMIDDATKKLKSKT